MKEIIYADGGSRGNPGPAASGFVVQGKSYGEFLGTKTNNFAEYTAIILGLKKLKSILGTTRAKQAHVEVRADSQLAVRQLMRQYKVEHPDIVPLFVQVLNAMMDFASVTFTHIPREQNKQADAAVNEVLDKKASQ